MKLHVNATCITNKLSYIHLLPLNEQNEELSKILHYFNINCKRNISSVSHYKLLKKAIMVIDKNMYGDKY